MARENLGRVAYSDKGAYDPNKTYVKKDVVQYQNGSYVLVIDVAMGKVPTDTSAWRPL